ncbi:MAG: hypothetical protein AAAB14_06340, partial [Ensifer adhaerens]
MNIDNFARLEKNSTAVVKKLLITTGFFLTYALAQSRTCLWVSADPRLGEGIGKVPGTNPSSRYSGQP